MFLALISISYSGCGGGSSGTSLGSDTGFKAEFEGVVVDENGNEISFAEITVLESGENTEADEAGAFRLITQLENREANLLISASQNSEAVLRLVKNDLADNKAELSILYSTQQNTVTKLPLILRARIIKVCTPLFLNTLTIRQKTPITEGLKCTLEVEMKDDGQPIDQLVFELQHRSCDPGSAWLYSSTATTGTSGPGIGEIDFNFKNDENHCVYRIRGPLNSNDYLPLNVHLHSLRKIEYDQNHR